MEQIIASDRAEILRAFAGPFNTACCRWAMRRAVEYLTDGTEQGRELAADLLRAILRATEDAI